MCGVFRYNMSAESPAKSTLSQRHGLSTGGGEHMYVCMYVYMYVCTYIYICSISTKVTCMSVYAYVNQ